MASDIRIWTGSEWESLAGAASSLGVSADALNASVIGSDGLIHTPAVPLTTDSYAIRWPSDTDDNEYNDGFGNAPEDAVVFLMPGDYYFGEGYYDEDAEAWVQGEPATDYLFQRQVVGLGGTPGKPAVRFHNVAALEALRGISNVEVVPDADPSIRSRQWVGTEGDCWNVVARAFYTGRAVTLTDCRASESIKGDGLFVRCKADRFADSNFLGSLTQYVDCESARGFDQLFGTNVVTCIRCDFGTGTPPSRSAFRTLQCYKGGLTALPDQ